MSKDMRVSGRDKSVVRADNALNRRIVDLLAQGKTAGEVAEALGAGLSAEDVVFRFREFTKSRNLFSTLERQQLVIEQLQEGIDKLRSRINERLMTDNTGKAGPDAAYLTIFVNASKELYNMIRGLDFDVNDMLAEYDQKRGRALAKMVIDSTFRVLDEMESEGVVDDVEPWKARFQVIVEKMARMADDGGLE